MSLEGFSAGACAVHPAVPAIATCSRCGNFMCSACESISRRDLCDACERIVGSFPLTRSGFDVSQALGYAWSRYQAEWVLPTLLTLVLLGVSVAFALVTNLATASFTSPDSVLPGMIAGYFVNVVAAVVEAVLSAGILRVAVVALQGQTPTVEHVAQGMRRSSPMIILQLGYLVIGSGVGLPLGLLVEGGGASPADTGVLCAIAGGMLLLMPVFLYVMLGVQNTGVETLVDPDVGVVDALKRSWAVADGARGNLFIAGLVGALVVIGGLIACCVGLIPAAGVAMYLTTATYLAHRVGVVPPPTRTFDP